MKKCTIAMLIFVVLISGCARIQQGDEHQVSIKHHSEKSYRVIKIRADEHCSKYNKKAELKGRFSPTETIFRCE